MDVSTEKQMCRQMCYLFSGDGDRQLSVRQLRVIPLTAVLLRPGHSPLVVCTTWRQKPVQHRLQLLLTSSFQVYVLPSGYL